MRISADGKVIEETDRVLRDDLAREIAIRRIKEIDETAELRDFPPTATGLRSFRGARRSEGSFSTGSPET